MAKSNPCCVDTIVPRDGLGFSYYELVGWATSSYWVKPINTDNEQFNRHWFVADTAQNGKVHYQKR